MLEEDVIRVTRVFMGSIPEDIKHEAVNNTVKLAKDLLTSHK